MANETVQVRGKTLDVTSDSAVNVSAHSIDDFLNSPSGDQELIVYIDDKSIKTLSRGKTGVNYIGRVLANYILTTKDFDDKTFISHHYVPARSGDIFRDSVSRLADKLLGEVGL